MEPMGQSMLFVLNPIRRFSPEDFLLSMLDMQPINLFVYMRTGQEMNHLLWETDLIILLQLLLSKVMGKV
jgi:hypothetical protein